MPRPSRYGAIMASAMWRLRERANAGWAEQCPQETVIDGTQSRSHAKRDQHQDGGQRHLRTGILHTENEPDQRHCRRAVGEYGQYLRDDRVTVRAQQQ